MGRAWYIRQARGATCPHFKRRYARPWRPDPSDRTDPTDPTDRSAAAEESVACAVWDVFGVPEDLRDGR